MEKFKVDLTRGAEKELQDLPSKEIVRILAELRGLEINAFPSNSKKLVGQDGCYRLRKGNYRILYEVNRNWIKITNILHRKEAYR